MYLEIDLQTWLMFFDYLYGCLVLTSLYIFVSLSDSWSFVIRTEGFRYCSYFIQIVHAISVLMIWLLSIYLFLLSVPRWFWNCFPFCRTICEWLCSYIKFYSILLSTGRVSQKQNHQRMKNPIRQIPKMTQTQKWLKWRAMKILLVTNFT